MSTAKTLTVGGVPEHFNLPWHLAIEEGEFEKEAVTIEWKEYPGGTGAMTKDLRSGALDVAVLLTEGIVTDICQGNPSQIIAPYVISPLTWGIHVPAASTFQQVADLEGKRFAISRYGSGSHLMAFVHAQQQGWNPNDLELVLIGDLKGARAALSKGQADGFMWEKAMTQPLVDKGEFRRVGECPTPWPCFVIAAQKEVIERETEALKRMLRVIRKASHEFKHSAQSIEMVVDQFGIQQTDASAWFAHTQWANEQALPEATLQHVMETLAELQLIGQKMDVADLYHPL